MTSKDIKQLLYNKYSAPAFAFLTEVADSTGRAARYADGIAISLYASTGFEVQGFEIKISHNDFMNEIKNPAKSDEIMKFCDRWWIVAPKGIIKKEELPATWGLIEVRGEGKLFTIKQAPLLQSVDMDRPFLAGLLRRATEGIVPSFIYHNAWKMGYKAGQESEKNNWKYEHDNIRDKMRRVREFEEASGMCVTSTWKGGKELGEIVKFVASYDYERIENGVERAIDNVKETLNRLETLKSLSELGKLLKK